MILRRLGNKSAIADKIIPHFPEHKSYIEPFFGAGGMFFNKPKVKFNIVNDNDSDVYNLFMVVVNQKQELEKAFYMMPIHSDLMEYWKKHTETDPIKKALRFLFLSNFSYLGKMDTCKFSIRDEPKKMFFSYLDLTFKLINDVKFMNFDFVKFFKSISFIDTDYGKDSNEREETFIYADPPYLYKTSNYSNKNFTEKDSECLLDCLKETKCKYAYSEFNNEFIINQAKQRNLNVIPIGERQNLKNREIEVLITNYKSNQLKLF